VTGEPTGRRTLVLGAGYVGREVARRCVPCVATTRSGAWAEGACPERVECVALAVPEDRGALRRLVAQADRVVIAWASGGRGDRRALYVDGMKAFAAALGELAPRSLERAVLCSSTSALPDEDGWVDEGCPRWPSQERGRIQREAEGHFEEACGRSGTPWAILRLGGLYGPGRPLSPTGPDPGRTAQRIHRDDAVLAIVRALALPPACSARIHVVDEAYAADDVGGPLRLRGKHLRTDRLRDLLGVIPRRDRTA
jgi:nucleoside-diphosphate-sugar epimerase